jgi:S1-C subfamily serine protease
MRAVPVPVKARASRHVPRLLFIAVSVVVLASASVEAQSDDRAVARRLSLGSVSIDAGPLEAAGFVVGPERWIVTRYDVSAAAVLEQASRDAHLVVHFASGTQRHARILATDLDHGIALIEVDGGQTPAPPLELADSDGVAAGRRVIAFGTPFGLERTLTHGLVTARHEIALLHGTASRELLQIDANIGPGPGGPLVDDAGRVVGLTTASEPDGDVHYAVPSNDVRDFLQRVRDARARGPSAARRPLDATDLGLTVEDATGAGSGVRIRSVRRGSPASRAGLIGVDERLSSPSEAHYGTVLLAIDGRQVRTSRQLDALLSSYTEGETLTLSVRERDEPSARPVDVPVVLDLAP